MSIRIEEVFEIQAHPDRVWSYLTDPRQVVNCLPGAELTTVENDTTFLGRVKVKVGPIVTAYAGRSSSRSATTPVASCAWSVRDERAAAAARRR